MRERPLRTGLAVLVAILAPALLLAQAPIDEHAAHHPPPPGPVQPGPFQPGPVQPGPPAGAGPGMEAMGEMMRGLVPPPKQLYPSLMELPDLSPEKRAEIDRAAHDRMKGGLDLVAGGLDRLVKAESIDDYKAMQDAVSLVREGLARFDSGLAAHRAIAEGRDGRRIALQWFKDQMRLPPPPAPAEGTGPWDLSWSHVLMMAMLITFAGVMIAMYFFKMRRASTLLQRLTAPPPGLTAPTPGAVAAQAAPAVPSPPAPRRDERQAEPTAPARPAIATDRAEPTRGQWTGSLRVAAVFRETPAIKTFRLMNPNGGAIPFTFLPGQFLTLAVALAGSTVKRSYTIASSPTQRDYVEITVKREESGVVSRYLHDRVQPGDLLHASPPQGRFTFTGAEAESIVLIGGGVGITPLMSVVRALTDVAWSGDIYLLYACRTTEDFVFREELERLQRRHANLHVVATMTRAEGTVWMGPKGRLTKALIADNVPDLPVKRIHVCGPPPMMDAIRAILLDLGAPGDQILTESFGPAENKDARRATIQTAMVEAPTATTPTVTFTISGKAAPLPRDATVLEAAEHVGVSIDNSCRAGTCGTCMVKLLRGAVTMAVEDGLPAVEKARGIILACQARSSQNLEVEA